MAIKDISRCGRTVLGLALIIFAVLTGTPGFRLIEGWKLFDSFYMTLTTIATAGYGEIRL